MIVSMVSGGKTSFECLRRLVERGEEVTPLFADTLTEDEDLYRFLEDTERVLGVKIVRIQDGRNIWQLFRDRKFIGNTRVDICSATLKRDLCRAWLKANAPTATIAFGLDWTEPHRVEPVKRRWLADGYEAIFPLCEKPYLLANEYEMRIRELGIEPPRLYAYGFTHNNCGGACVKAGQGQWARLLATFPERYAWHEEQELETREVIGKDVTILRDSIGGPVKPMTLRDFRLRIEAGKPPQDDLFTCNCFAETESD